MNVRSLPQLPSLASESPPFLSSFSFSRKDHSKKAMKFTHTRHGSIFQRSQLVKVRISGLFKKSAMGFVVKAKGQKKHTTAGIRWWSPTQLLICRSEAYVWQSGRDAQIPSVYGRM
jgi:hypothetical protein